MNLPDKGQIDAGLRHVYTSAGTLLTLAAAVSILPKDQVQPVVDALHQVGDGLQSVFGGLSKLWIILGPVIIGLASKGAMLAASLRSQIASVKSKAAADTPQGDAAKVALVNAAASLPEVEKVVAPAIAESPTTAPNVVSK